MADSDSDSNVQMEPTVFTSEDILNRCVWTPTGSISATSTADTIYLGDIGIDSSDTIRNDPLQEESPDLEIDEERIHAIQYPSFADRYYLAKNTKTTEWHKSCDVQRNVSLGSTGDKSCSLCPRIFNSDFNFTLHVYWHTLNEQPRGEEPYDPMEEDDSSEDEDIIEEISYHKTKICDYKKKLINDYNISPGTVAWLTFCNLRHLECHPK